MEMNNNLLREPQLDYSNLDPKLIGRYYTPLCVAQSLVNWAVTSKDSRILDPSFGGCSFFDASVSRLTEFGEARPGKHLYGVDIDPLARRYLTCALRNGGSAPHFLTADFLSTAPSDLSGPFDSVVGNPPYVRHHSLAAKPAKTFTVNGELLELSGLSNYWAYFVLHALQFVAPTGRLAFVLPGSFLFADYGAPVRTALARRFSNVYMIIVGEHLFPEAEEISVLILAHGLGKRNCNLRIGYVHTASELDRILADLDSVTTKITDTVQAYSKAVLDSQALSTYRQLSSHPDVRPLGTLASVRIGVVTGCNDFFLRNKHQVAQLKLRPDQYVPALSRHAQIPGPRITAPAIRRLSQDDEPLWMLTLEEDGGDFSAILDAYLAAGAQAGISDRRKCRERDPWYSIRDCPIPDAFLPSMSFHRTYLVGNVARVTSTNTIHHIFWERSISHRRRQSLVGTSLSTLFALSSELNGRRYGGGLLKMEPSDANRIECLNLDLESSVLRTISGHARAGRWLEAQELVDEQTLTKKLGLSDKDLAAMRTAVDLLRHLRRGSRNPTAEPS